MPSKSVDLTVEVFIDSVSCPGVWLCPEGDVSLTVFALGSSHHTAQVTPMFPLLFRDTFFFRKRFRNACSVSNIQCALRGESIYCELVQWRCRYEPCVLAQYLGSLSDVLFPPNTCSTDGVDLLMRSTNDFPGILAPKIELSTKVRVDEVFDDADENSTGTPSSPLGSSNVAEKEFKRQKAVCHSRDYHRYRCSSKRRNTKGKGIQTKRDDHYTCDSMETYHNLFPLSGQMDNSSEYGNRVARVIESENLENRRSRSRVKEKEDTTKKRGGTNIQHNYNGPCVCEICRRYHELFHS